MADDIWDANTLQLDGSRVIDRNIYIDPKARVVIVIWSAQPKPTGKEVIPNSAFFDAVVAALK